MPLLTFRIFVVRDDSLHDLLALFTLLPDPKQFHSDSLAKGIEVLIQEQLLHLLVDLCELIDQYPSEDDLILLALDKCERVIEHLAEVELESPIQLLRLQCDDLNSRANDRVILGLVVPPNQRHLLDHLEELPQHIDRVKQHLECLLFVDNQCLAFVVGLLGGAALDDEAVVRLQKLSVEPVVLSQAMFKVGFD